MARAGLPDLVARAFEAACDADGLTEFVRETAGYFAVPKAAVAIWPVRNPRAFLPVTHGISDDELQALFDDRHRPDSLFWTLGKLAAGKTFESDNRLSATHDSVIYSSAVEMNVLAGVASADENNRCGLALFRDSQLGTFSRSEHESLQFLLSFFKRAVELNKRYVHLSIQHKSLQSVLDSAPRAILVLGQRGQVTYQNDEARKILKKRDGLQLTDGVIQISSDSESRQFFDVLKTARYSDDQSQAQQRMSLSVTRNGDFPPFQLMVYMQQFDRAQAALEDEEALAIVMIYDPTAINDFKGELLQTFYEMTRAEAFLTRSLFHGQSLPEAADSIGVSINTARTHLKSVFKKVGVNSQATLLREIEKSLRGLN